MANSTAGIHNLSGSSTRGKLTVHHQTPNNIPPPKKKNKKKTIFTQMLLAVDAPLPPWGKS